MSAADNIPDYAVPIVLDRDGKRVFLVLASSIEVVGPAEEATP